MRDVEMAGTQALLRWPVTYSLDGGGAVVVNHHTGYRWERGAGLRDGALWHLVSPQPASATTRVARLIAHPDTHGDDIAAVLRLALIEPWLSVLRRAGRVAAEELGVSAGRIRAMRDLVTAVMAVSELLPHRVVLVVDDPAAAAAAYQADAELAGGGVEAVGYRYAAGVSWVAGQRVVVSEPAPRDRLVPQVVSRLLQDERPGQRHVVEPLTGGAR